MTQRPFDPETRPEASCVEDGADTPRGGDVERRSVLKGALGLAGLTVLQGCREREQATLIQNVTRSGGQPGVSSYKNVVCGQCPAGCGLVVRVVDGEAKKIEGNKAHPVNHGGVCALGHSSLQEHYHPDRLGVPHKRSGEAFAAAAWDEALEALAEPLLRSGPATRVILGQVSALERSVWEQACAALGAPAPVIFEPPDVSVERAALAAAFPERKRPGLPHYDIASSDLVVSVGAAFLDRWHSPVHYASQFARFREQGVGRLVQIEPHQSLTGANADDWLPVRPGSEGVLLSALLGSATFEQAAAACGLPQAALERLARQLESAGRPLVLAGGSALRSVAGRSVALGVIALNQKLGAWGRARGGVTLTPEFLSDLETPSQPLGSLELTDQSVVIVHGADVVHGLPTQARQALEEQFSRASQVVALASFYDDTALAADWILPVHSDFERFSAVEPSVSSGRALSLCEPALEPMGESRHPTDIALALLAQAASGSGSLSAPGDSGFDQAVERVLTERLAELPGGAAARTAKAYLRAAQDDGGIFGGQAGGQAGEQAGEQGEGTSPVPVLDLAEVTAALPTAIDAPASDLEFELIPFESIKTGDGRGANRPWLQELPAPLATVMWNSWIELSTPDAAALEVSTGDFVTVKSPAGDALAGVVVLPSVRPGTVAMPLGFGQKRYAAPSSVRGQSRDPEAAATGHGVNVLDLIRGEETVVGTSVPATIGERVTLEKVAVPDQQLAVYGRGLRMSEHLPRGWGAHGEGDH